jgi:predicted nucleotidyltransferase component of viral defense system
MITKIDLQERVGEWSLREEVVEKDYALGWVLWGIGSDEQLRSTWVFKGGTCLKKCYIETYRFSEDLDFTILPGGAFQGAELDRILKQLLERVADQSGINFSTRSLVLETHVSGLYTRGRIYYQGPRNAPTPSSIILDLSASERVIRPTVFLPISHPYPDALPEPGTVQCYAFEELFAEKIRAMAERGRPRDLYDIINLFRRPDLGSDPALIRSVLAEKCVHKSIAVPTYQSIVESPFRAELESEWANMLEHQLPALPPFPSFFNELSVFFSWLEGQRAMEVLASMPAAAEERGATPLVLPRTVSTWGVGVPLEAIRFAGANHLCVRLGYDGTSRIIEPYSLRRTRDGHLILHAIRTDNRSHRSYRVDRIQSVQLTNQAFTPVYQVEFTSSGPIQAPPTSIDYAGRRSTTIPRPARLSGRSPVFSGRTYVVRCPYCQKQFKRSSFDLNLNPHKHPNGHPCPGRRGFVV